MPEQRLRIEDPFSVTGLDFAGPFEVLVHEPSIGPTVLNTGETPGISGNEKFKHMTPQMAAQKNHVYILLFTCATTRAVHLEVTRNKSTAAFLNAFRRFCAHKRRPRTIISDNAKEFECAAKYLKRLFTDQAVGIYMATNNIVWRMSPKLSSWWGGFWERMVRTVKLTLYKTFNPKQMEYDMFSTVVTEVSDIVNNRPLVYVTNDRYPITPNQLIKGGFVNKMGAIPLDEDSELSSNASHITKRETERRKLVAYWWSEFHAYYLRDLNRNYVATKRVKPIQLGQVVIAFEANKKRIDWPVGRVTELVKGRDKKVRQVKLLLMKDGVPVETTRAIQCLYPLEVEAGTIDADFSENPSLFGDYVTSAGELWKQAPMGGVLNYSTAQDADESTGNIRRAILPRLVRVGEEMTQTQSGEGMDERPMTTDEMKAHRKKMTETDVGRQFDMIESFWAQDVPPSN
jgi:hypothetical protein